MGLTSALFTGLSGLNANQFRIDVIGDNIANINTTAFKGARAMFQTQFSRVLSAGSAPGPGQGGTNPIQVGLGSIVGQVQRTFGQGSLETTGVATDLAIEGNGFFVVRRGDGQQLYTRDGSFLLSSSHDLVTADGFNVQGYGVDENFTIVPGQLVNINIPLGSLSTAAATTAVTFDGNLNSTGDVATQGSVWESNALVEDGIGTPADGNSLMTSLRDSSDPGTTLFAAGDTITVSGVRKGGRELPEASFTVDATSTLDDFTSWLEGVLGINTDTSVPGSPGITISSGPNPPAGTIVITGNVGTDNELTILDTNITSDGAVPNPFAFTQTQEADGESLFTSFLVYDSLGAPVFVDMTLVLEDRTSTGSTWRFYGESADDTDTSRIVGTGTLTFDTEGKLTGVDSNSVVIDRDNTGAADPLTVTLDFSNVSGLDATPTLVQTQQDGFPAGTLSEFSIGTDGVITGVFTNGLTRTLGQVVLATFSNPEGLIAQANNTYVTGANSGEPVIVPPLTLGAGRVLSGALELSNVDLSREFIGLITASTGFSAAGRVISTSNELLDELLLLAR